MEKLWYYYDIALTPFFIIISSNNGYNTEFYIDISPKHIICVLIQENIQEGIPQDGSPSKVCNKSNISCGIN